MFLMDCLATADVSGGRNFSLSLLQWTSMYCFNITAASCRTASWPPASRTNSVRQTPNSSVTSRALTCSSACFLFYLVLSQFNPNRFRSMALLRQYLFGQKLTIWFHNGIHTYIYLFCCCQIFNQLLPSNQTPTESIETVYEPFPIKCTWMTHLSLIICLWFSLLVILQDTILIFSDRWAVPETFIK